LEFCCQFLGDLDMQKLGNLKWGKRDKEKGIMQNSLNISKRIPLDCDQEKNIPENF